MSSEDRNQQAQCMHITGEQGDRKVKYTGWLIYSILVCVFGNSFLHGYNIGVVNSPAPIIKLFYAKVTLAKAGRVTKYKDGHLYYVDDMTKVFTNVSVDTETHFNNTTNGNNTYVENGDGKIDFGNIATDDGDPMDWWWSMTVASFVLFGMFGAFVSGKIADGFGRKRGMNTFSIVMVVAAVLGGISPLKYIESRVCLVFSRALAGLYCGVNVSLAPIYLAEIAPKKIRGAVGTAHQLFITVGLLWSMVMGLPDIAGTWTLWQWCFAFNAVPAVCCLLLFPCCPESPRFLLIKKGDELKARKALSKLRGYQDVDSEIDEMRLEAMKASTMNKFSLKKLLTIPELRKPLIIAVVCQIAQQWSGINAMMSYSSFIYQQANVPMDKIPYVIVAQGTVNVLATIVAIPLLEKVGRRPLLISPMAVMALSFMAFMICCIILQQNNNEESNNGIAIACIVFTFAYIVGFAIGLGPVPYVVVPELFRQESRAAAVGFSLAINWICNLILMLSFRFIQKKAEDYVYLIFVIVIGLSAIFFYFCLPETKNRTFDDIADSVASWKPKTTHAVQEVGDGEEMQPMNTQNQADV